MLSAGTLHAFSFKMSHTSIFVFFFFNFVIFRLDVLERTKERRRRQMENGYLFWKPTDSTHLVRDQILKIYDSLRNLEKSILSICVT